MGVLTQLKANNWPYKKILFVQLIAISILCSSFATASDPVSDHAPVGATVMEFLAMAKTMNPERKAAALEADATAARLRGAGALPDPMVQFTLDDISKNSNNWPERVAIEKYSLQQELPWWGKRALQKKLAEAENQEALGNLANVETEIALRIKTAYADYHRIHLSMDQTADLIKIFRTLVQFAQHRYAQGMATQSEATSAEAERGALQVELIRLGKERNRIRSRLNTLVYRQPDAPIVEHPHLRPLPPSDTLNHAQLLARALAHNPTLTIIQARKLAAKRNAQLAEKAWYPDINVGIGLVNRRDPAMENSYEAMMAFTVPLQWQNRQAKEQETHAKLQSVQQQLAYEQLRIKALLQEGVSSLDEAREVEQITKNTLLPQAHIALQSAMKGYQTGITEAIMVIDAIQRLKKFQIDLLKIQFEAQIRLAEIEQLIGGEL